MRRVVIDAPACERICVFNGKSRVLRSGRDNDGARVELEPTFKNNLIRMPTRVDVDYRLSDHDLGTEFLDLRDGSVCELLSRDSSGKAEIVFDP
jgi:hypothetical protein